MSETEPILPPVCYCTQIPILKKGEYDLWVLDMMRSYCSKDFTCRTRKKKQWKALIYALAIPDRQLLSFHDDETRFRHRKGFSIFLAVLEFMMLTQGGTLKPKYCEPAHNPKGSTQSYLDTGANYSQQCFSLDEIICSFFAQQASMPTTHADEEYLLQIDEAVWKKIGLRGKCYD
ncbi:hypothetical protein Tco_0421062 [Tanacetum coccineum]